MMLTMAMAAALPVQTRQATPPQRARANLNQYFSTEDYPESAARRGAQGTTAFRLLIDADGTVTGCTITQSSGDAALDAATCSILLGRMIEIVSAFDLDPAGRRLNCRIVRDERRPGLRYLDPPDLCEPPPNAMPIYSPSKDGAPRHAKARLTVFFSGWPLAVVSGEAPRPNLSAPPALPAPPVLQAPPHP